MADTEAFDLIADIEPRAVSAGGAMRDHMLAFDHVLPDADTSSYVFANAHILIIDLPTAVVARDFLKDAGIEKAKEKLADDDEATDDS
jgi:hypothetical protein